MKNYKFLIIAFICLSCSCSNRFSKHNYFQQEFKIYDNGLIYSQETMNNLRHIVDSLNKKFSSCNLDKEYYSVFQAVGQHVRLNLDSFEKVKSDLKNDISLEDFQLKYPNAKVTEDYLLTIRKYKVNEDEYYIILANYYLERDKSHQLYLKNADMDSILFSEKKWRYKELENGLEEDKVLKAFYLKTPFEKTQIPNLYSDWIQYTDCLIDTSHQIYIEPNNHPSIDENLKFGSVTSLEEKKRLLDELRRQRVIGMCSMDQSPRIHAKKIAVLSAETANWEIFLRAHLDILNDNFFRLSDGSYALAGRNTYLKEIEELNIDIVKLFFGIALRIENQSKNHYFGSISRLGRALSKSKNSIEIRNQLTLLISDPDLDDFNRMEMFYLFQVFDYYTDNADEKIENRKCMKKAIESLPPYLKEIIPNEASN